MFQRRSLRRYERTRVVVNCDDGKMYAGLLEHVLRDCIVLRATEMRVLQPTEHVVAMDGDVILLRDRISVMQAVS